MAADFTAPDPASQTGGSIGARSGIRADVTIFARDDIRTVLAVPA